MGNQVDCNTCHTYKDEIKIESSNMTKEDLLFARTKTLN